MSRLRADLLLVLVALIWGFAFVAQKNAFAHVGACTFVFSRFLISAALVFPFARREWRRKKPRAKLRARAGALVLFLAVFSGGVILQQSGMATTSVTNAGFLTGLYVIFVPLICRIVYRQSLSPWIYPAALLSLAGTFLLSGGSVAHYAPGDNLVILCAVFWGMHVSLMGVLTRETGAPLTLACLQYAVCALAAGVWMLAAEHPSLTDIAGAFWPILYAGVLSGGIAYTLQAVAQQYAPAADAAIIMSGESLFAALGGAWLMGERLSSLQYTGCILMVLAMLMAEAAPLLSPLWRRAARAM